MCLLLTASLACVFEMVSDNIDRSKDSAPSRIAVTRKVKVMSSNRPHGVSYQSIEGEIVRKFNGKHSV